MHNFSNVVNVILQIQTRYDGNSFDNGPAPPSPASTSPPPSGSHKNNHHSRSGSHNKTKGSDVGNSDGHKGTTVGGIVGITLGSLCVAVIVLFAVVFCIRKLQRKEKDAINSSGSLPPRTVNGAFPFCSFLFPHIYMFYDYVMWFLCQKSNKEYTK